MAAKKSKARTKTTKTAKKKATKKKAAKKVSKKPTEKVASKAKRKATTTKSAAREKPAASAKKQTKKAASKARAPSATKRGSAATKKVAKPPMHNPVNHPELDDEAHGSEAFEIFRVYDRDASGSIDREEFVRLLEALSVEVSEDELAVALNEVDQNHSGKISWREFKTWWEAR